MDESAVDSWLAAEASDHLLDGPVGLYELLWWLNGSPFELTAARALVAARQLTERLAGTRAARLHTVNWPAHDLVSGPLPLSVLDDEASWREGSEFVALVPSESHPPSEGV